MIYFTSDLHIGHERIIELCDRPFSSVDEMNTSIIERWNQTVSPEDVIWVLGDVALGSIQQSLQVVSELNGKKLLVPGNHDRCFSRFSKKGPRERDFALYRDVGFTIHNEMVQILPSALYPADSAWLLCHFPFAGDSGPTDRYSGCRPWDNGQVLIHGHTHSSGKGSGKQVHVGMDAWDFRPVSMDEVVEELGAREHEPENVSG